MPSNSSRKEIVLWIRRKAFHDPDEVSAGGRDGRDLGYRPPALRDENPIRRQTVQQLETLLSEITDVQGLHITSVHTIVHFGKIVQDRLGRHYGFQAKEFEPMVVQVRVERRADSRGHETDEQGIAEQMEAAHKRRSRKVRLGFAPRFRFRRLPISRRKIPGDTYTFTRRPDGTTEIDVVVVRDRKNVKGQLLGFVLRTIGKGILEREFVNSVKAIKARNRVAKNERAA
jgi:hypothetical protein